jgi:hypothetical protein
MLIFVCTTRYRFTNTKGKNTMGLREELDAKVLDFIKQREGKPFQRRDVQSALLLTNFRLLDKTIQRLRRNKIIAYRDKHWYLVEKGEGGENESRSEESTANVAAPEECV